MNLDNLLNFPTPVRRAPANTKRAITERRVIAQMRNHLSEPVANGQDCLNEYRRMAVSVCREHIATLVELEARQELLRVNHWLFEAMKHLKGIKR